MNAPEMTQVPVRALGRMHDRIATMEAALRAVMRMADEAKEPCSTDPESPAAIRNGRFASIAQVAAQGLGWVQGPPLTAGVSVPPVRGTDEVHLLAAARVVLAHLDEGVRPDSQAIEALREATK